MTAPGGKREISCASIDLSIVCPGCNHLIPVNGILSRVYCPECGKKVLLSGETFSWKKLLFFGNPAIDVFESGTKFKNKKSETGAFASIKLKAIFAWPKCKKCSYKFSEKYFQSPGSGQKYFVCPKCSEKKTMVPAPDLLIKYYKRALLVIGEITEIPVEKGAKPVKIDDTNTDIFQCSSCNANLPVSVTVRTITCEFCGSLNYLPESLFHKLANEKTKDWYIIFDSTLDYGKV